MRGSKAFGMSTMPSLWSSQWKFGIGLHFVWTCIFIYTENYNYYIYTAPLPAEGQQHWSYLRKDDDKQHIGVYKGKGLLPPWTVSSSLISRTNWSGITYSFPSSVYNTNPSKFRFTKVATNSIQFLSVSLCAVDDCCKRWRSAASRRTSPQSDCAMWHHSRYEWQVWNDLCNPRHWGEHSGEVT